MHLRIFLKGQCQEILLYIEGKIICELISKWVKKNILTLRPFANNNPKMYRAKIFKNFLNPSKISENIPKNSRKIPRQTQPKVSQKIPEMFPKTSKKFQKTHEKSQSVVLQLTRLA